MNPDYAFGAPFLRILGRFVMNTMNVTVAEVASEMDSARNTPLRPSAVEESI